MVMGLAAMGMMLRNADGVAAIDMRSIVNKECREKGLLEKVSLW